MDMPSRSRLASRPSRMLLAVFAGAALTLGTARAASLAEVQQLITANKLPQAMTELDALIAANPKDPQYRFLRGVVQTEQHKSDDAIATFSGLTQQYPELPEPYNNLAVLYAAQGQYDKARSALEMAIRTNPSYGVAYENLGDVYARLAAQAYQKAEQFGPADPAATRTKLTLISHLLDRPSSTSSTKGPAKGSPAPAAR